MSTESQEKRKQMNWHERIAAAEQNGYFTIEDRDLAGDWVTCACGEQDKEIPRRGFDNAPEDRYLYRLGVKFSWAVDANNFESAKRKLALIERRAAEVLSENRGKDFNRVFKGMRAYHVALAFSQATRGIDWRGCTKGQMREDYIAGAFGRQPLTLKRIIKAAKYVRNWKKL